MEYNVQDYSDLDNAASVSKTVSQQISDIRENVLTSKSNVFDEDIFCGPIAESCMSGFEAIDTDLATLSANFKQIEGYMTNTSETYKEADAQAAAQSSGV